MVSFPQVSLPKSCIHLPSPLYVLHVPLISFLSILSPEQYLVRSTDHSSPYYVVFLHSPVTSSLLGPNILLTTLFSNTLSLRSSFNMSHQVSHPYKTRGKILVLCIIPFRMRCSLTILSNTLLSNHTISVDHTALMHYSNHTIAISNLNFPPFKFIILKTAFEFITVPYHNTPLHYSITFPFQCITVIISFQRIIP